MSALKKTGSTTRWRKIRRYILDRDGWTCRVLRDGRICGRPANTVDHIITRANGGTDHPSNLRAACGTCNYRDGAYSRRSKPAPAALTGTQARIVAVLDRLGIDPDAGRRTALRALQAEYVTLAWVGSANLDAACAWRRNRTHRRTW